MRRNGRSVTAALLAVATALLALAAALSSLQACSNGPPSPVASGGSTPTTVTFNPGSSRESALQVEVASTPEERRRGLMSRRSLAPDGGMLFVFPEDSRSAFWMKDTFIPLSIAFISADGRVIDIQDMTPLDETLHYSPEPYRFAVEANQGWFAAHGVQAGDSVRLPPLP